MFKKLTVRDADIENKIALVRVDYNVPLKNGAVASDLRIKASLPTINYLLEHKVKKIILISHLGRPDGKKNLELSMAPVATALQNLLLSEKIKFISDVSGPNVEAELESSAVRVFLLENLRFFTGEEENSEEFIRKIIDTTKAEFFVQDGFAVVHRAHASTSAVAKFLPAYAGLLLEKEIENLSKVVENPEKPLLFILGGAKVEDKQPLIEKFKKQADEIIVGGKIAADGYQSDNGRIYVAEDFDEDAEGNKLDIGPVSTAKIVEKINQARTVVWNGVLGKTEDSAFATSSTIVAKTLGENPKINSIICGGDTTGFVENLVKEFPTLEYTLVSTGGGASLEFLCGKTLPGLEVIPNQ